MEDYQHCMKQATCLEDEGDVDGAIRMYHSVIREHPRLPGGYYNLALLYHSLGRLDEATENFQKAAELNPADASIYNNLAVLYYSRGLMEKAESSFKRAIEIEPNYADALYGLGRIYQKHAETGNPEEMQQYINTIKGRIHMLYEHGRSGEAWEISTKLVKLLPDDPEAHNDHAVLSYELGKTEEAREAIHKARELASEHMKTEIQENYQIIHSHDWGDWHAEITL